MKKILLFFILFTTYCESFSQIVYYQGGALGGVLYAASGSLMPEHGFLPGKKFPIYETIEKYNFNNKKIKVLLSDSRTPSDLKKVDCSNISLTNSSEFKNEQGIVKVSEYINKLFTDSGIIIDKDAPEEYEISLMALDTRLIGFGNIDVHGLCQIKVKHNGTEKIYCTDIQDGDKNAPLSKSSFVSRKTATRLMMSAAIRETIENIIRDMNNNNTNNIL
ncbi:hypothetical protein ELOC111193_13205 [Elizabethkingia occulta]|uniref:Uncharacterized protein n=1 Tax=Elizabethkingia occulta TaxID=1867263 RepID=A0A1T3MCD5_9FLAO|nr:hypothetical protein [Elizabethkingia occulta]OPB96061.1 hypothetical protein BB020_16925 [Elizabethkingia occulta]OPC61960.1 hypothetical protein BAZ10_08800 [Elizabethkingia occulta]